jgi:hypothetical protein
MVDLWGIASTNEVNADKSSGHLETNAPWSQRNISSASHESPSVKSKVLPYLTENLRIWSASIKSGLTRFRLAVTVSFADEKTRSQGTADAWIGRISMASRKIVGYRSWFSCKQLINGYEIAETMYLLAKISKDQPGSDHLQNMHQLPLQVPGLPTVRIFTEVRYAHGRVMSPKVLPNGK